MRAPTEAALGKLLIACARGDVVAPYNHTGLLLLEQRKLIVSYLLVQANGRLARSKRWSITEAGRASVRALDGGESLR